MAKKIKHSLIRSPIGQDKCILQLQVAVKSKLLEAKVDSDGYAVELQEELEQLNEPKMKIIEAVPTFQDISCVLEEAHLPPCMLSIDKQQRKHIGKSSSIICFEKENGGMVLQIQGRKGHLKQLIRATLLKSCGSIIGLYQGKQKTKIIHGTFKFKRDGLLSKCILPIKEANKLSADLQLMQDLCNEDGVILLPGMVEGIHRDVVKYWLRRYSLFSRFDEGVKLDEEGLFSVTPEEIAKHQAAHCGTGTVIDAFTGVGGNAIQFACMNFNVIAIDIDPKKIEYARHNAEVYGVANKIDFLVGDFLQLAPTLKADVVFLSPPWGGPEYIKAEKYNIETMLRPTNGFSLFKLALSIAPSVAFFLPRTVDTHQLAQLSWLSSPSMPYEIERNYVNDELKAVTAYYGKIVG